MKAIYYPYSQCLNLNALKRAVLIFDEIWLSDPLDAAQRNEFFIRDRLQWKNDKYFLGSPNFSFHNFQTGWHPHEIDKEKRWRGKTLFGDENLNDYIELFKLGILKKYNVKKLVKKYDKALAIFLQSDLQDNDFLSWHKKWLEWVDGPHGPTWQMLSDRIPKSVLTILANESNTTLEWLFSDHALFRNQSRHKTLNSYYWVYF